MDIHLKIEEGCEHLASGMLDMAKEFKKVMHKYPPRNAKTRHRPETYMTWSASRGSEGALIGKEYWDMWAYHTKKGIHVGARKRQ